MIAAVILAASPVRADEILRGVVVAVADGDTVTVLDETKTQHKIRVAGIDAPEKAQPFGQRSKENLSAIALKRHVEVIWSKKDRYGRTVGKVMVADPNCHAVECTKIHDAGLMQVMSGLAWHYKQYEKEQSARDRRGYAEAEGRARVGRVGLWRDNDPTAPWEWRRQKRQ